MNSILYFLDPRTELNDKLFRYATLRSHILPEIKGLVGYAEGLDVKIIISKSVYDEALRNELSFENIDCLVVDENKFNLLTKDTNQVSVEIYHNTLDLINQNVIKNIIKGVIPPGFEPDVIISYEAPSQYLKEIFPSSLLLNSMFGIFSRAPFPAYGLLDPCGLYEYSYQYQYADKIKERKLQKVEKEVVQELRTQTAKALASYHPFKRYLSSLMERYSKLVVLACQVDDYFSYSGCASYKNQYEMIVDVMEQAPNDVGVIITGHGYKQPITDEQINFLSEQYNNFIYCDEGSIPTVTQFILPYMDGALSVSSSIGYQAALWHIPYFGLGCSQIDIVRTHNEMSSFFNDVNKSRKFDRDNIIYDLISRVHFSHKNDIFDGESYYNILNSFFEKHKSGIHYSEYFSVEKVPEVLMAEICNGNREWLLKKNFADLNIVPEVDYLRLAMTSAKAVSYDLFDTLVERDFVEPHELFGLIEPRVRCVINNKNFQFHYIRRQAEIDLRRETKGEFEITLEQIYSRFMRYCNLTVDEINCIKEIEINAEIELVHPKKEMIREYYFSMVMCDSVSIITDIYLDREVIEKILIKNNIVDYNHLLVSAETKTRKHNGTIYPEYLKYLKSNYGITPEFALHVGDNKHADGLMSCKYGMKSYCFSKAIDNYKKSKISHVMSSSLNNPGVSSSILNGMFANKYHAGHWFKINNSSLFNGDEYNYGYKAIGPLVAGFIQWLHRRAKKLGINKLYFLSRDGWILKETYDHFYPPQNDTPETFYLYSSRRAAMVSSIRNVSDIIEIASQNFNARKLSDFLQTRFGIDINFISDDKLKKYKFKKDTIVSPQFNYADLLSFLSDIKDDILYNAEEERISYLDYLDDIGFIEDCTKNDVAVIDIGYSGSMQYYLKKVIQCNYLHGFYFLTHHHSRDLFPNDHFEGYLQSLDDHKISYRHGLNDHVFIFEAALSSPEGSLIKMEGVGSERKLLLLEAEEEIIRKNALLKTHAGVLDFVHDIKFRFGSFFTDIEFSPILSSHLILNFANEPNGIDAQLFVGHEVENVFGGGSVCLITPLVSGHKSPNGTVKSEIIEQLLNSSKWKKGASEYYKYISSGKTDVNTNIGKEALTHASSDNKHITYAHFIKNKKHRKLAKFIKNPYAFFNDSKKPIVRCFRLLFKSR